MYPNGAYIYICILYILYKCIKGWKKVSSTSRYETEERERERARESLGAAFQRANTVDTVHSFRTEEEEVEGSRILGQSFLRRRFFDVEGGSWKAGRPSLRSPIIFEPSNKAIRMLGCTRRLKERNEDGGQGRRPTTLKERECIEDLFLIIREMPLNTECRLIDYSRYAANTHSARASSLPPSLPAFDFMIMVMFTRNYYPPPSYIFLINLILSVDGCFLIGYLSIVAKRDEFEIRKL